MDESSALSRRSYVALFLVTMATLMYEILLTRIFSATMWYHFAFVAISVAMFGMTVGAVIVYLAPGFFRPERAGGHLAASAFSFGIATVLCFLTQISIPFAPDYTFMGIYCVVLTYVVVSIPFVFSGICVCIALTRFPRRISGLYAADLAGAAFGCIVVLLVLRVTNAITAMFVVAMLAMIAAHLFARDSASKRLNATALVFAILLVAFVGGETARVRAQNPLIRLRWIGAYRESPPIYEAWNTFSRIRVFPNPDTTYTLSLLIDTIAATPLTHFDGTTDELEYLKYDITNLCHYIRHDADVCVVGSGGGKDILSALAFGQKSVLGVEINGEILKALNQRFGDSTGHLDRHPKVRFVNDEARSYVTRSDDKFDIIQISLIDTWAATAAGAFVLTENALYTVEAWESFLKHLKPNGVLTLCRWYFGDRPGEMYRLTSLATASLLRLGVKDPRKHIVIVRSMEIGKIMESADGLGTILVSRAPFSDEDLKTLNDTIRRFGFETVLTPHEAMTPVFAQIASGKHLAKLYEEFPINISPPTDDKPFFFHMLRLRDVFDRDRWDQGVVSFNMKAVVLLAVLLATVVGLTLACIIIPVALTADKSSLKGALPYLLFFASIGFGFMLIEISQLQRLIVFLGHPTYSLTVVLFSLLLSSGLGSWSTWKIEGPAVPRATLNRLFALLFVLAIFGAITPGLVGALGGAATPVRILIGVAILFPIGLMMGMAFPLGMKLASGRSRALTPWLWGINGATSVCASVLAVAIALAAGISMTYWTGVAAYLLAALAVIWATRNALRIT